MREKIRRRAPRRTGRVDGLVELLLHVARIVDHVRLGEQLEFGAEQLFLLKHLWTRGDVL